MSGIKLIFLLSHICIVYGVPELPLELYDPAPSSELVCGICLSVLHGPVQTVCRHVFCKKCIREWLSRSSTCPNCRQRSPAACLVPAIPLVHNMLANLTVKCRYPGCGVRVTVENYEAHRSNCEFQEVPCPNNPCEHRVPRSELDDHVKTCPFRPVTCSSGCGAVLYSKDVAAHRCVPQLEKKLEEMTEDRNRLRRTLGILRNKLAILLENVSKLHGIASSCQSGEAMAATGGGLQPSTRLPSPGPSGELQRGSPVRPAKRPRLLQEAGSSDTSSSSVSTDDDE